ncbi:hypothetical protein ACSFXN_01100 [Planococcus sp. 1R117A]|uniref:hypothetical protein n=1 Tax=Planococcus sp. 1R117A TaxID=3447020 RepID=UPI003EDC39EC
MKTIYKNYPLLLILASFGPYLSISLGIRADNVLVYIGGVLFLVVLLSRKEIKIYKNIYTLLIIWFILFCFLFFRTVIFRGFISINAFVAEINNFTQPLFILFFFACLIFSNDLKSIRDILVKTGKILLILLSLNTLWIFLGMFVDLTVINQYFWRGENSVASRAALHGRFSGIFNQPVEAGICYSIGLFVWIYIKSLNKSAIKITDIVILILIVLGGSLTVSKVFIIFSIPLFLIYLISVQNTRRKLLKILLVVPLIYFPIYSFFIKEWTGLDYFLRLFDTSNYKQGGVINLVTAGRYGSEASQQSIYFKRIFDKAPIIGEGLGSQNVYDSAFFHIFSSGGLTALGVYILLLIYFIWMSYKFYKYSLNSQEFKLFLALVLITIFGGLGAPVLTLNRSSVVLWVFLGLLLQFLSILMKEKIVNSKRL